MSIERVDVQPIMVLHTRPYRNTSLLVDVFSQQFGRVSLVAKSARGPRSRFQGQLQLFSPLLASWVGRHELKTLTRLECAGVPYGLQGAALLSGFYINELLMRLLDKEDAYVALFDRYRTTLSQLTVADQVATSLRYFEKHLLHELGYGLLLEGEVDTQRPFNPHQTYRYVMERGFVLDDDPLSTRGIIGQYLIDFQEERLAPAVANNEIKQLMRMVLSHYLGTKPLKSRELFVSF